MSPDEVRGSRSLGWPLILVSIALIAVFWRVTDGGRGNLFNPNVKIPPITPRGDLAEDEQSTISLFKRVSPSVVHITTLAVRRSILRFNEAEIPQGTGSGFIWDGDGGYVVTNYHVIAGADAAKVTLSDNTSFDARLVGTAKDQDIAVLKIDSPKDKLQPIDLGTSSDLLVGQKVFAIGNPFGLDHTLTTGIISGLGREIESVTKRPIQGVIQTDAAINPGNSGGPLLDSAGRLIGMNTAIVSPSGTSSGVGFAVPVDVIREVVPKIIATGKVERPGLGISIAQDAAAKLYGWEGVLILEVVPDGAAAVGGLRPTRRDEETRDTILGDRIVGIDGQVVRNSKDLFRLLSKYQVGDVVEVKFVRDQYVQTVTITLQAISE